MSSQLPLWEDGLRGPENRPPNEKFWASIEREVRYLLAISMNASGGNRVSPTGVAHSLSVCMIEAANMARGGSKGGAAQNNGAMPKFVDIRLSPEQRHEFAKTGCGPEECFAFLRSMVDRGYRVGCQWSGEAQSYTVSLTCRAPDDPNNGLCVTSFAGDLMRAIWLARYKHFEVAKGVWSAVAAASGEEFG